MENTVQLKVKLISGEVTTLNVDVNTDITVVYANGEEKVVKITKAAPRSKVDINEMTIDELRAEIRNSHSVHYKNVKRLEELKKDETANAAALAKFDYAKLEEQKARFEAADKLFETKFPGQPKAIGAKTETAKPKKNAKVDSIEAMIATITAAPIPEEQKNETLRQLNVLLDSLKPKAKVAKSTDAAPEVKTEAAPEAAKEEVKTDAAPADVAPEAKTDAPSGRRFK